MRARLIMWVLVGSFAFSTAHSMTLTDYMSRKAEKNIAFYVAGVGSGFYYAMNTAGMMGQRKLYCPASGPGPSGEFYIQVLDVIRRTKVHQSIPTLPSKSFCLGH